MSDVYIDDAEKEAARKTLSDEFRKCVKSLTPAENWFIQALLNDEINHDEYYDSNNNDDTGNTVDAVDLNRKQTEYMTKAAAKLSNEKLFSSSVTSQQNYRPPLVIVEIPEKQEVVQSAPPKARRPSNLGLWKAYEDGVHPQHLIRRGSRSIQNSSRHSSTGISFQSGTSDAIDDNEKATALQSDNSTNVDLLQVDDDEDDNDDDDDSENRIIPTKLDPNDDGSSWDSQDDADHRKFDAWEVLKDEYAKEFGFDFVSPVPVSDTYTADNIPNSFQILGTSADDTSVQPHVMSPPMMDALMNFLPDSIIGQNYWLRYSLIRDGASLETLQRYVRATECTIITIETRNGEVFGSFTSHPWHKQYGFYGSTPAFVWKMRHSRRTKCSSLFDQAQLESEIDVFMALKGSKNRIQVCHHDAIGVGGDDEHNSVAENAPDDHSGIGQGRYGFAFYLNSDLSRGTTSQSLTFHSPSLCGNDGTQTQIFDIAGLEVWSLTPCFTVMEAEKLEMTKFFIEESIRNISVPRTPQNSERSNSNFSGDDFDPRTFYQRVGHDAESQARRDRWEYMNTMHTTLGQQTSNTSSKGIGSSSPRFGYGD